MVAAARKWRALRVEFRKLDKARPAQPDRSHEQRLKRAGTALFKAGDALELSIRDFEKALSSAPKAPIPWQKILQLVSNVAGAAAGGVQPEPPPPTVHARVIDVTPE